MLREDNWMLERCILFIRSLAFFAGCLNPSTLESTGLGIYKGHYWILSCLYFDRILELLVVVQKSLGQPTWNLQNPVNNGINYQNSTG